VSEETEHFHCWPREQDAKSVHCGEPKLCKCFALVISNIYIAFDESFLFQLPNPLLQELPRRFLLGQRQSFLIRGPGLRCPDGCPEDSQPRNNQTNLKRTGSVNMNFEAKEAKTRLMRQSPSEHNMYYQTRP